MAEKKLVNIAEEKYPTGDPSHDLQHALRVLNLAKKIAKSVNADLDIIVPAALFHDVIVYPKNSPKSKHEATESSILAGEILNKQKDYPKKKIDKVKTCILQCSFSKGIIPELIEAKVLQDADRLEATGAISIMRTFSSGGQMKQPFYFPEDPFHKKTEPVKFNSGIALFYRRLLVVESGMHTSLAKKIAKRRTKFLKDFLKELRLELKESDIM